MKDSNTESGVMMGPIVGLMGVDMLMRCLAVRMWMIVNLDPSGPINGPKTDPYQQEADNELGPHRPGVDVDEASQEKSHGSNDSHTNAMSQTPEPTYPPCARRIIDSDRGQGGQVVYT
jgi:hypothetical protein